MLTDSTRKQGRATVDAQACLRLSPLWRLGVMRLLVLRMLPWLRHLLRRPGRGLPLLRLGFRQQLRGRRAERRCIEGPRRLVEPGRWAAVSPWLCCLQVDKRKWTTTCWVRVQPELTLTVILLLCREMRRDAQKA